MTDPILDWVLRVSDVPDAGLASERVANETERATLARKLELASLSDLRVCYRLSRLRDGAYRLKGDLKADLQQMCIVSIEPIPAKLGEPFDIELRVAVEEAPDDAEQSVLSGPDVETFDGLQIPLGRIVFETLSASLDPYPRKQGAEFSWQDEKQLTSGEKGPFSILSKFKERD